MREVTPPSADDRRVLERAGLEPEDQQYGWGLVNLADDQIGVVRELRSIAALVLFETCDSGSLTEQGLSALADHPSLLQLDLGPGVTDAGLAHLSGLRQLRRLRLDSATDVTDAGMRHLQSLEGLEHLSLQNTRVGDNGLRQLERLIALEELQINNTDVTDDGLRSLARMSNLEVLHICGSCETNPETMRPRRGLVTDAGLAHLKGHTKLRFLSMDSTAADEITSKGLAALASLQELDTLLLRGPAITDEAASVLATLARLRHLFLTDTSVSKKAVASLQQALPTCKIRHLNVSDLRGRFGLP